MNGAQEVLLTAIAEAPEGHLHLSDLQDAIVGMWPLMSGMSLDRLLQDMIEWGFIVKDTSNKDEASNWTSPRYRLARRKDARQIDDR